MFFHLPERIYGYIKDDETVKALEDELKERSGSSFSYSAEKVEKETELLSSLTRAIAKALTGAPDEVIREFRIMTRCENVEYLKKCAALDMDRENRLCCFYQLTNCNINVEANKHNFLYEYSKAKMSERARFSSTMHNVYYIFRGEAVIANSLNVESAIQKLLELRRKVLEVRCDYHNKLEKTTSVEFIAHLLTVYFKFREAITTKEVDRIISLCLDMKKWNNEVYDDVWLGNFRTTQLLGSVLVDRIIKKAPQEKIQTIENLLAGYLVSSFADRENTIKSLTTHNEDFRAMYLVLVAACIRLLEAVDKDFVESSVTSLMGEEEKELILGPMKDESSLTPITEMICASLGYENWHTDLVKAFELETRKEFVFLQQFLVDEKE